MAITLGKDNQLKVEGSKKAYSRSADQLSDQLYPPIQGGEKEVSNGHEYFKKLLGSLEKMLVALAKSTNAGSHIDEIAFVDIYKKIFVYLDNQGDDLFSVLSEKDHKIFFDASSRVATFQNAASELKEMTADEMDNLKVLQNKRLRDKEILGDQVADLNLPDIGLNI